MSGVEGTPIAWVLPSEELVRDTGAGVVRYFFADKTATPSVHWIDGVPADAVPLVPATEARSYATGSPIHNRLIAEWLIAKQKWHTDKCDSGWKQAITMLERAETRSDEWEGRYETEHALRVAAEERRDVAQNQRTEWAQKVSRAFRVKPGELNLTAPQAESRIEDMVRRIMRETDENNLLNAETTKLHVEVERLKASPQLPALDTPEALRYAADVLERVYYGGEFDAHEINRLVRYLERLVAEAEAVARADADREARAQKGYETWRSATGLSWSDLGDDRKDVWRAVVDALS